MSENKSNLSSDTRDAFECKNLNKKEQKQQGIVYTPEHLVEAIVKLAFKHFLKADAPAEKINLDNFKILDPATGSGAFLIKSLSIGSEFFQGLNSSNIFGCDIRPEAVETSRKMLKRQALYQAENGDIQECEIENNIMLTNPLTEDIFSPDSIDIILGNPPYIRENTNRRLFAEIKENGTEAVKRSYEKYMDFWQFFGSASFDLLKPGGILAFIVPSYWMDAEGAKIFRKHFLDKMSPEIIVDFGENILFKNFPVHTMILVARKRFAKSKSVLPCRTLLFKERLPFGEIIETLDDFVQEKEQDTPTANFSIFRRSVNKPENLYPVEPEIEEKLLRMEQLPGAWNLDKKHVMQGITAPQTTVLKSHIKKLGDNVAQPGDGIFLLTKDEVVALELSENEKSMLKPYTEPTSVKRYELITEPTHYIIYTDKKRLREIDSFEKIKKHLDRFESVLTSDHKPYGLHRAKSCDVFDGPKLLSHRKCFQPTVAYAPDPLYVSESFYVINQPGINPLALMALLNSSPSFMWLKHRGKQKGRQLQIDLRQLTSLPLPPVDDKVEKHLVELVRNIQGGAEIKSSENKIDEITSRIFRI